VLASDSIINVIFKWFWKQFEEFVYFYPTLATIDTFFKHSVKNEHTTVAFKFMTNAQRRRLDQYRQRHMLCVPQLQTKRRLSSAPSSM
jgi:hypothetical protein